MGDKVSNKRQRKKYLKQKGEYISNGDLMDFDVTLAQWILPRLKQFKEKKWAYPSNIFNESQLPYHVAYDDDSLEKDKIAAWNEVLDKMIRAFELIIDFDNGVDFSKSDFEEVLNRRNEECEEGLMLFAKWYRSLWF